MDDIYPEKRIHTRSFPNVETERLQARFAWIKEHYPELIRQDRGRNSFADLVREIINIERELAYREIPFVPFTDGNHLKVPTDQVRRILPAEGRKR